MYDGEEIIPVHCASRQLVYLVMECQMVFRKGLFELFFFSIGRQCAEISLVIFLFPLVGIVSIHEKRTQQFAVLWLLTCYYFFI